MERGISYSNTNIVNEYLEDIVKLHFKGFSVKDAIKEVRIMKALKLKLDKLIIKNNFNLTAPEVIKLSQKLDKEIVKQQRKGCSAKQPKINNH